MGSLSRNSDRIKPLSALHPIRFTPRSIDDSTRYIAQAVGIASFIA